MKVIITACIIMHDMIIVDEWEDETLDQKYLKDDRDSAFVVDKLNRGKPEDSQLISNHIRTIRKEYMSYTEHMWLKSDLVEHLWEFER